MPDEATVVVLAAVVLFAPAGLSDWLSRWQAIAGFTLLAFAVAAARSRGRRP